MALCCRTSIRIIHKFLNTTGGNWRNSIYVECRCCKYKKPDICAEQADWLYVSDSEGTPLLLPVSDAKILFSRAIDKSECLLEISNLRFQALFQDYIMLRHHDSTQCPLLTFCK